MVRIAPIYRNALIAPPVILFLIPVVVLLWPTEIFTLSYWQQPGVSASRSEVVRNLGLLAAGVIGLFFGIWRAWTAHRQANIAEQGQFTERFTKAAEQLGSPQLSVRFGGIYSLWRLARDSDEGDLISVMEILCAFVRDPTPVRADIPTSESGEELSGRYTIGRPPFRPDVQAILNLIGNADDENRRRLPEPYQFDLAGAELAGAYLVFSDFSKASFSDANLTGARLSGANLTGASFVGGNLGRAKLLVANLTRARCDFTNLIEADLMGANLSDTKMMFTNLTGANLVAAKNLI